MVEKIKRMVLERFLWPNLDVKVVIVLSLFCGKHSDMLWICPCQMCKCDSKGVTVDDSKECETCQ